MVAEIAAATAAAPEWAPGGRGLAIRCDVTDEASVADAVAGPPTTLGPVTAVCNVAGIGRFAHTAEQSLEGWDKMLAVNLTGTFLVTRATLPAPARARRVDHQRGLHRRGDGPGLRRRLLPPPREGWAC